jgi:hypothetical protein
MDIGVKRRFSAAFGALVAMSSHPAFAQPAPGCVTMGNMTMCQDGRMMMGGMWFAPPVPPMNGFVMQNQIGPGETAAWSAREFVNPDGSRTQRWERTVRGADGVERREVQERVIFPDGRVCTQDGPTLKCP